MVCVGVAPDAAAAQGVIGSVPPPELTRVTTYDPFEDIPSSCGQATELCLRWMDAKSVDLGDEAKIQTDADIQRQSPTVPDGPSTSMLRRLRRKRAGKMSDAKVTRDPRSASDGADELLEQLEAGGEAGRQAAERWRHMAFLSTALSHVAQEVLEMASKRVREVLAAAMHRRVRAAMCSRYANYVLQKLVELMPVQSMSFVAQELLGAGPKFARQKIGCRIFCRLLECKQEPSTAMLLEEILADAAALNIDANGNYVTRHILQHGLPEQRQRVVAAIRTDTWATARQQYGCRVVEAALQHAKAGGNQAIATELLAQQGQLAVLAKDPHGVHVTRALMKEPALDAETRQRAKACLSHTSTEMNQKASNTATA